MDAAPGLWSSRGMNGASAEYVTRTDPSFDAPRVTIMLVQAWASPGLATIKASRAQQVDRRILKVIDWLLRVHLPRPRPKLEG